MFFTIVTVVHVFACVVLITIVLLQHGRGADAGATFGGGSNSLFGAGGADTFLTKATTGLAALFMLTSITLAADAVSGGATARTGRLFSESTRAATTSSEGTEKTEAPKAETGPTGSVKTEPEKAPAELPAAAPVAKPAEVPPAAPTK